MNKVSNNTRRTLITLIVVLAVVQVGILVYLWSLLRPAVPPEVAEPTIQQFQLPSAAATSALGGARPTPAPGSVEIVVGPLVHATNYVQRARMFDEERALEHIAYLASDELGGRQPGTPGGWAAGDYIVARFAEYGLEPGGLDGSYFQTFTVPYGRITEPPVLTIIPPRGETLTRTYAYRSDYRALTGGYLGAGVGEGPVVWLNECLHDGYASLDLDMVGKIVMCRYTRDVYVYRQAIEHQVGGLLLLDREREGETFRRGGYRETAWVPQTIPAYLISETIAQDLLIGTGYTLDDLSLRFTATPLSTTVRMAVILEEQEQVKARNVLGLLPGSDPAAPPLIGGAGGGVVVFGAHYDHLGREPDGTITIMNGANDNASGVATMLEIARLWQAQDYRPARSVLFAAWDGEEQGLLGSRHYVQNPTYPLTRTVAMLNLDMVGAGEALQIDGEGAVAAQLQASAEVYGVTTTLTFNGGSDHFSFYQAGIPAAMPIWWPDTVYHTPNDKLQAIEPEKLKTVGVLSAHTLAALADGHVELERAVERLRASIITGDRDAFLEGLDPTDPDPLSSSPPRVLAVAGQALRASQAAWFDNLWSRDLVEAIVEPDRIRVGDGEADVTLTLAYRWADGSAALTGTAARREPSVSYDVRFVQRDDTWTFAGYELDELSGDVVTVARFPSTALGTGSDVPVGVGELLSTTQETYVSLAADLGFQPITSTRFIYYPNGATMRNIARPAPPSQGGDGEGWLVPSAGLAEIAWGQPITPALVNLALTQMGLPPDEGAWLREGLVLHYTDGAEKRYLPALAGSDVLTPLLDFPTMSDLPVSEAQTLRGYAWSATEYLLDRYGTEGLRALCAAWGRSNDPSRALQEALGLSPAQFESAWRAEWLGPLRADAEAAQAAIAARVGAALAGDEAGFLSTVNPANPVLRTEERNWFADLADHPIVNYAATGELASWSPGGEEALVALNVSAVISGGESSQVSYNARFVRNGKHWLYDGVAWNELASEHFVLKYNENNHDDAWARHVLDLSEAAYAQVTADLDAMPPLPQEIRLYDDGELFRTSVLLSLPSWASGWTEPGEAIKCRLRDDGNNDHTIPRIIAHELAHQVLFAQGLEVDWLHEGVANFEAGRVIPLGAHWTAGRYLPVVQEAVNRHREFPLYNLPPWRDVPDDQAELFYAQSWSVVSFITEQYGLPGLRRFIAQSIASQAGTETRPADDTSANLRLALGANPDSFLDEWREHTRTGRVPGALVALAQRFDTERALTDIATLSSPEYGGREAGTAGADLAAATIAEQFAALGLEPLGDPLMGIGAATETVTETATMTSEVAHLPRGYLQRFPISHTHLISVPTLALLDGEGTVRHEFAYHEDFVDRAGAGTVEGELVWVRADANLEGMRFGGAVVLEQNVRSPIARAVQLQDHGAGGLIIATNEEADDIQAEHVRPDLEKALELTIPVFKITGVAFESLLERLGITPRDLVSSPPALPLGAQVRQTLTRLPVTTTLTSNVLGLLPGSDPDLALANEVILIGAHYDHIGQSPDGLTFPGANQNGSGVGALLEMARAWQAAGYRPARSVLFAAWGAEELDSAGVAHYLADPAIPLTRTVGVIALDSIAGGKGYKLLFYGTREHEQALIQRIEAGAAALERRAWRRGSTGEGWHEMFNQAGIPTLKLIWDDAESDFYSPTDTADAIDLDRLATSGEILTLTAAWLAGW